MASMLKTITTRPGLRHIFSLVLTATLYLMTKSIRWRRIDKGGLADTTSRKDGDRGVIFVCWHSRIVGLPTLVARRLPLYYMSSTSRDGTFIAGVVQRFGLVTIWGSSSRGGVAGYRAMLRLLKEGKPIGLTPDGPRGPARKAAAGVVSLAQRSGAPVIPVAFATRRMPRMKTWDRLAIPAPFSAGVEYWGAAFTIPSNLDSAAACRMLEDALNTATADADSVFGHPPDHVPDRYGAKQRSHRAPEPERESGQERAPEQNRERA